MIQLGDRIRAFATVGNMLKDMDADEKAYMFGRAKSGNSWFTDENLELALNGIGNYLQEDQLKEWTRELPQQPERVKKIGVVMAGNIPLVGFHDFLVVLISGHQLLAKLSTKDSFLLKHIASMLTDIEPRFDQQIAFLERLNTAEVIIATGSDNSSRYFEHYFSHLPHVIRRNRTSVGVLKGDEQPHDYQALGKDVFQYFGLGCRNVSKLYIPQDFDFDALLKAWQPFEGVGNHHKYNNNYDYNKSIFLINQEPHYDTGFALLRESEQLVSPVSVVYFERYKDVQQLEHRLKVQENKIQCIVSRDGWLSGSLSFGQAQQPKLWDYADGIDTLAFLQQLDARGE